MEHRFEEGGGAGGLGHIFEIQGLSFPTSAVQHIAVIPGLIIEVQV